MLCLVSHFDFHELEKNNLALYYEVLNIFLQFQVNPTRGSSVIVAEKYYGQMDKRTDRKET